jgi:hypothetical protein
MKTLIIHDLFANTLHRKSAPRKRNALFGESYGYILRQNIRVTV